MLTAHRIRYLPLFVGLLGFVLMQAFSSMQTIMPANAWSVASLTVLMAIWWATEAIPVAMTALLPLIVLPLLGAGSFRDFSGGYSHPLIFLFLGAFILALGIERTGLHRRIALAILTNVGTEGRRLIGGFMFIAAVLSMGMTNTSTTMMLLPIALSVASVVSERDDLSDAHKRSFSIALLLGLAFGATIGGMATLIGTPPNALVAAFVAERYGIEIGFVDWLAIGLPITCVLLPITWYVLTHWVFPSQVKSNLDVEQSLAKFRADLPAFTTGEKRIAIVFLSVVVCWMLRPWLSSTLGIHYLSDAGIALFGALILFVIPTEKGGDEPIMNWSLAATLPWSVLLLFGGGLSLASAVSSSGLATWLGEALTPMAAFGSLALIFTITYTVVYLTELTSNLATTATFLPIVAAMASQMGLDPLMLCIPVALAASCAFMLPVATAPNAIVYSSGVFEVADMARAGMRLNIIAGLLVTVFCVTFI